MIGRGDLYETGTVRYGMVTSGAAPLWGHNFIRPPLRTKGRLSTQGCLTLSGLCVLGIAPPPFAGLILIALSWPEGAGFFPKDGIPQPAEASTIDLTPHLCRSSPPKWSHNRLSILTVSSSFNVIAFGLSQHGLTSLLTEQFNDVFRSKKW